LDRASTDPSVRRLVDSGRLAEPYWYLDSALTTPGPGAEVFPVDPGAARPPVAGVICPDAPCTVPDRPDVARLRQLFGDGFVLLLARKDQVSAARAACAAVTAPVAVHAVDDIDHTGAVATALRVEADSAHLVRPDGYLAAVPPRFDPAVLRAAVGRATGQDPSPHGSTGSTGSTGPAGSAGS
ncbi:MAG TPA: pentachlorophenol monooxygenase, partial [Mycobacteriales bacterium]